MKHNILNLIKVYLIVPLILMSVFLTANSRTPQLEVQVAKVDWKQVKCLATNIYYEAGSETTEGKAAVARVVVNRVNHGFESTPCKVVYQTTYNKDKESRFCQFSWVCEGKGKVNERDPRYQKSLQVAYNVLVYDMYRDILPNGALFFHAITINPEWPHRVVATIGNHIFYSKINRKKKNRVYESKSK